MTTGRLVVLALLLIPLIPLACASPRPADETREFNGDSFRYIIKVETAASIMRPDYIIYTNTAPVIEAREMGVAGSGGSLLSSGNVEAFINLHSIKYEEAIVCYDGYCKRPMGGELIVPIKSLRVEGPRW